MPSSNTDLIVQYEVSTITHCFVNFYERLVSFLILNALYSFETLSANGTEYVQCHWAVDIKNITRHLLSSGWLTVQPDEYALNINPKLVISLLVIVIITSTFPAGSSAEHWVALGSSQSAAGDGHETQIRCLRSRPVFSTVTQCQVCLIAMVRCRYELWNRFCLLGWFLIFIQSLLFIPLDFKLCRLSKL